MQYVGTAPSNSLAQLLTAATLMAMLAVQQQGMTVFARLGSLRNFVYEKRLSKTTAAVERARDWHRQI